MKKLIAAGAALLCIGGASGCVIEEGDTIATEPAPTTTEDRTERTRAAPHPTRPPAPVQTEAQEEARALETKIEQVQIGASYAEASSILGAADWSEEQSTDFGYDVIYWYDEWAVYTTDYTVTSVSYYG